MIKLSDAEGYFLEILVEPAEPIEQEPQEVLEKEELLLSDPEPLHHARNKLRTGATPPLFDL